MIEVRDVRFPAGNEPPSIIRPERCILGRSPGAPGSGMFGSGAGPWRLLLFLLCTYTTTLTTNTLPQSLRASKVV
ncbi:uncharacterized [Tachysurus ichikawai]